MSEQYNEPVGENLIYYEPSETDALVSDAKLMYEDLKKWLDECESADAVFDTVIEPYYKGNPPSGKRVSKKRPEYDAEIKDAKKKFDDTLEKLINYIIDYSNDNTLMMPQEVAVSSSTVMNPERFEITDEVLTEESVIVGEVDIEGNEVNK